VCEKTVDLLVCSVDAVAVLLAWVPLKVAYVKRQNCFSNCLASLLAEADVCGKIVTGDKTLCVSL
jgi:predicted nucleic-acid-binding protein